MPIYFQEFLKITDLCFDDDGPFDYLFIKESPICKYYSDDTSEFDTTNSYNDFLSNASLCEYDYILTNPQDFDDETYNNFIKCHLK